MFNDASRCQKTATGFARHAEQSGDVDERNAYLELARLWSEMAGLAERFDREHDDYSKARIYAMIGQVDVVRLKSANLANADADGAVQRSVRTVPKDTLLFTEPRRVRQN
jgi:hypothetical protein